MYCDLTDGAYYTKWIEPDGGLDFNLWEDKYG
jgi:hypothetical protein